MEYIKTAGIDSLPQAKVLNFRLIGLDCANCAAQIEAEVMKLEKVEKAYISIPVEMLSISFTESTESESHSPLQRKIQSIIDRIEPGVKVEKIRNQDEKTDRVRDEKTDRVPEESADEEAVKDVKQAWLRTVIDERTLLIRIGTSLILLLLMAIIPMSATLRLIVAVFAYMLGGYDVFLAGVKSLSRFNISNEKVLMTVATVGAFILGEYSEAVAVMLFYQVGEFIQDLAVDRSRDSITELIKSLKSDHANLIDPVSGHVRVVKPADVLPASLIQVRAGEKVPLDGLVKTGRSYMDTAALTGESMPRAVEPGDLVSSGFINSSGLLTIETIGSYQDSTVERILRMVREAAGHKAPTERYITRFAKYYTPAVMVLALLIAVLPPLLLPGAVWNDWIYRALIFLVVSCPCALVVSVPLGFFGGIGNASKKGILVKGAEYLEALAKMDTVIFDKTGTLTEGRFTISKVRSYDKQLTESGLLELAAIAEQESNHPLAASILEEAGRPKTEHHRIRDYHETPGRGTVLYYDEQRLLAGNAAWMHENDIVIPSEVLKINLGTTVYIAREGSFVGLIQLEDKIKHGVDTAIKELKKQGVRRTIMLTGDAEVAAAKVSAALELDAYEANCLPQDKIATVERYQSELKNVDKNHKLIFVGDGINDAPALARADVGVAMGALGQAAAIEAADVVLLDDNLGKLAEAHRIARFTKRVVAQNIVLALGVKLVVLALSALGYTGMWGAVFADVGVTVIAVLNSVRVLVKRD